MLDAIKKAEEILLAPAGLSQQHLQKIISQMMHSGAIDSADLYFQSVVSESWLLEDSLVKEGIYNVERGVGVRALTGDKTGFAYSDDIYLSTVVEAAKAAKSIAHHGQNKVQIPNYQTVVPVPLYQDNNPLHEFSEAEKIKLLQEVDRVARAIDPRVNQVVASLSGSYEVIHIVCSDGHIAADIRPMIRFNVSVIVESQGRRETGTAGGGGRQSYSIFFANKQEMVFDFAKEAVRQALLNLEAIPAPAGVMPVVLAAGWPGILLHEAIGHGLEGDFNRKGTSAFSGRIGERVAVKGCTVVDDGTLANRRGSLTVDDEGVPSQCTTLIEDGILRGYMQDKLNARLMGMQPTGNGRRQSYAHIPLPRMTNTYMLAGNYTAEEIIASVDKGIYAVNFGGGQVDITSGKFVFSASEAYLIENGRVTTPIKGATLIGHGPEVLTRVSMIGNNLELDTGVGVCGKDGQSVPVGVGQPTLKVDSLTVGGTNA